MKTERCTRLCLLIAALAAGVLTCIALWWAPLNQDEGWYLMASRRVSQGQMPYRDFAFTQGPLFPYVLQIAQPLIRWQGVLGGRLFQLFWLGMTFWVLLWGSRICVPKARWGFAALLLICLLGLNVFQLQFTATIKTYTLAGYFLSLSLLGWLSYHRQPRRSTLILCAAALAAATATRLSLGLFFIPFTCDLLSRRTHKTTEREVWWFPLTGGLCLLLLFLPFFREAPEGFRMGLLEFHTSREAEGLLLLKAGFLSRMFQSYLPALLLLFVLLPRWRQWQPGLHSVAAGIFAVSLLHLLAPFHYDEYQSVLYPALVLLIAIESARQVPTEWLRPGAVLLLLTGLLGAFSSPQLPGWFSYGPDRIWWRMKPESDLHLLRETARSLKELAPDAGEIFTSDTYLAIETNWEIPEDMEMGPFSFFPDLETHRAKQLQVLNTERLLEQIRHSAAPLAALSGYSFSIQSPSITPTPPETLQLLRGHLKEKYQLIAVVDNFGQANTGLSVYRLKNSPDQELRNLSAE
ncbi:MAG: hypothetical protein ACO3N7_01295 [Kiritimatiellia bacterium]